MALFYDFGLLNAIWAGLVYAFDVVRMGVICSQSSGWRLLGV